MNVKVLASAERVSKESQFVKVAEDGGIERAAQQILDGMKRIKFSRECWRLDNPLHPQFENDCIDSNDEILNWIFLIDLMNFSFWSDDPSNPFTVKYQGNLYTGYWSLCAAIKRALSNGIPVTSPEYMRSLTISQFDAIFQSETTTGISFHDERIKAINEAGEVLCQKFEGSFMSLVSQAEQSCQRLIEMVISHFPTFNDVAQFNGEIVYIYKRVQILVADIWACFDAQGPGFFHDIDSITMFADYRVPQALIHLGVISYSETLMKRLQMPFPECVIQSGDLMEVEIRANSIWAVELVRRRIEKILAGKSGKDSEKADINAILIDFYTWDLAKANSEAIKHIPVHKTRTIFY